MQAKRLTKIEQEIEAIRNQLQALGAIHPGSISEQYQVCGKPGCKCTDPTDPQPHGPYGKLSYVHRGKKGCRFVREELREELLKRVAAYKEMRSLVDRWIALSIEKAQIEFFPQKPSRKNRSK